MPDDISGSTSTQSAIAATWWRQACIYQLYPRSFADANGDGIGDFKGVTSHVEYLKALGVDAIWFSPFYPSDHKDGGYDVADYRDVDPRIGSLEDFDEMVNALHQAGLKTLVDIIPNHCSNKHIWFQAAMKAPRDSRERSRFIFKDGLGEHMELPPNDWESYFGGSAWEPVGDGQYYLHMYDVSQPDFNWDSSEVRQDFIRTLQFWTARGVDGFRIDVALGCAKDLSQPYLPQSELDDIRHKMRQIGYPPNQHPVRDRDAVLEIYREWRREVFNKQNPPLMSVAEAWVAPDRRKLYAAPDTLGQSFALETLACAYSAKAWTRTINLLMEETAETGSTPCWAVSNHDFLRHASRYGLPGVESMQVETTADLGLFTNPYLYSKGKGPQCDLKLGSRRARAITLMLMGLPGSLYIYQGEELGLPEVVDIPDDRREDPAFFRTQGKIVGRDGCRVPLPWTKKGSNYGFGSGKQSWLPQPEWFSDYAVEAQAANPVSSLNFYQEGLRLRRLLRKVSGEQFALGECDESTIRFRRDQVEVVVNFGATGITLPGGELLIRSDQGTGDLSPDATAWVKVSSS